MWNARISPLPIWGAVALHLIWGGLLLLTDGANGVTAISSLFSAIPSRAGLGLALIGAALCSAYALADRGLPPFFRLLWLLPQQLIMTITAAGCVYYMWLGRFADRGTRPTAVLFADQIPAGIFATIYTLAVLPRLRGARSWISPPVRAPA